VIHKLQYRLDLPQFDFFRQTNYDIFVIKHFIFQKICEVIGTGVEYHAMARDKVLTLDHQSTIQEFLTLKVLELQRNS
jgi:hypothetical protein